ncbi:spore protease YyaC [Caldisalinibacter kiritimatiensis]|uniref:Spore protease GPR related protein n=1 Tax=Caldisalinibacter kiritimatiensis TaxID=1304284 RepID=R1ARI3_9FIRM|nr:spore protease YyaC [Caldisalinibacter kiritimatiensis]EOC99296.1 Spore protease GPR related protein [Caldisalinibacter kiritimatiensis]
MNTKNLEIHFKDKSASEILSEYLRPFCTQSTILLCIGTDKCIGDCLGPLVGTLLEKSSFPLPIYGTLNSPVHAINLKEKIKEIKKRHPFSFVIAIDACLSSSENIGTIEIRHSPIFPGKGIGKTLPPVGDLSIIGIVDSVRKDKSLSLHSIRLSFVMDMAEVIVKSLLDATDRKSD